MSSSAEGVFFFHNPKAGGTAVQEVLASFVPEGRRAPIIENNQHDHERLGGDYSAFAGFDFYAGHYGVDVYDQVGSHLAPVTNVRHPVDRIRSLYNFYRLQVDVPDDEEIRAVLHPVVVAQAVDFAAFVMSEDPMVRVHTRDFHTRQLASSPWEPDAPADVDRALGLLEEMPWIYVCEEPDLSQEWGAAVFGEAFSAVPRTNVTAASRRGESAITTVDPDVRGFIESHNAGDLALHERASARLRARRTRRRWWHLRR